MNARTGSVHLRRLEFAAFSLLLVSLALISAHAQQKQDPPGQSPVNTTEPTAGKSESKQKQTSISASAGKAADDKLIVNSNLITLTVTFPDNSERFRSHL